MRSARTTILAVTALVVLLPFVLLGIAWVYERTLITEALGRLGQHASAAAAAHDVQAWSSLAKREHFWLRHVRDDAVLYDSNTRELALSYSLLGGLFERMFALINAASHVATMESLDAELGRFSSREVVQQARAGHGLGESRSSANGESIVVSWAEPLPDGSFLVLELANHRGVRQLLLARNQLVKLVLVQLFLALVLALVLARWLVNPLEQLASGARAFPAREIASAQLISRRDELGQVARAFNDVTHSLEGRRQTTQRLAADLAHELKNPLATIEAASEWMATMKDLTPEKRAQVHETIHEAVRRLQRTTEVLVSEVRFETELDDAKRVAVDYRAWLEVLIAEYRRDPRYGAWLFELEVEASTPRVTLAPEAWARLLRNLIDNALMQPTQRHVIRVEARCRESTVETDVIDYGPGVSEGNREKIFRRFFTQRPDGAAPGMGLGLSIVDSVARAHRGAVVLLPSAPERGAAFRVTLPLQSHAFETR